MRDELGLDLVQHSLDLVDLDAPAGEVTGQADRVRAACAAAGLTLHSTFTGLAAYSSNLLLHPDPAGFGAAMLAADAAGLSGEASAAIAATVRRARRFAPSGSLSAFEGERAAWFDQVRPSAAVHSPGS